MIGGKVHIDTSTGYALGLSTPSMDMYTKAIEVCSGIAVMSQGLQSCGCEVVATNDIQAVNCAYQIKHGNCNVIQGDINSPHVIASLHASHGSPSLLSGGFSCQPWSALGDRKGLDDPRSESLIGTLRAGYFLRAFAIELECVLEASRDPGVRAVLTEYCKLTGFRQSEAELTLDSLMPTKRSHWWCILANGTLPPIQIAPLPKLSRQPVVGDLLPVCPSWPPEHLEQLELDQYETGKFAAFGGIEPNLVKSDGVLRTALHGWANQLTPCPCKCRKYPMSEKRLQERGLFGALVKLEGEHRTSQGVWPKTRHLHPWEMCVTHGVIPAFDWLPLRYTIAALGQMASPIQSCWITGHLLHACNDAHSMRCQLPEEHLWNHFCRVFHGIAATQPSVYSAWQFQSYVAEIRGTLLGRVVTAKGPIQPLVVEDEKNETTSHRTGREDLKNQDPLDERKADQTQALEENRKTARDRDPRTREKDAPARDQDPRT